MVFVHKTTARKENNGNAKEERDDGRDDTSCFGGTTDAPPIAVSAIANNNYKNGKQRRDELNSASWQHWLACTMKLHAMAVSERRMHWQLTISEPCRMNDLGARPLTCEPLTAKRNEESASEAKNEEQGG